MRGKEDNPTWEKMIEDRLEALASRRPTGITATCVGADGVPLARPGMDYTWFDYGTGRHNKRQDIDVAVAMYALIEHLGLRLVIDESQNRHPVKLLPRATAGAQQPQQEQQQQQ